MNKITKYINKNPFNWERILIDHDDDGIHCARIKCGKFMMRIYGDDLEKCHHNLKETTELITEFINNNPESPEAITIHKDDKKFKFEINSVDFPKYKSSQSYMFKEEAGVYGVAQMALFYKKEKIKKNGLINN